MSKSILIIDTPESCAKCPLFIGIYNDMVCRGNGGTIDYPYPDNKVQDWCPLEDIPKRIEENSAHTDCEYYRAQGYNSCIDEILKERD